MYPTNKCLISSGAGKSENNIKVHCTSFNQNELKNIPPHDYCANARDARHVIFVVKFAQSDPKIKQQLRKESHFFGVKKQHRNKTHGKCFL